MKTSLLFVPNTRLLAIVIFTFFPLFAISQVSGYLDPNFGNNGVKSIDLSGNGEFDYYTDMALLPNQKMLVSGNVSLGKGDGYGVLSKFTLTGNLDNSFGTNGMISYHLNQNTYTTAEDIHILPNQKILMGGSTSGPNEIDGYVIRLNNDGSIDNTFNSGQPQLVDESGVEIARSMLTLPSGEILLGGEQYNNSQTNIFIARVLPNGGMDNLFAGDGVKVLQNGTNDVSFAGMVADASGNIYFCGTKNESIGLVGKLNANGTQDVNFGTNGYLEINDGYVLTDMDMDASGNLIISGYQDEINSNDTDAVIIKVLPTGVLDNTFHQDGIVEYWSTYLGQDETYSNCLVLPEGYFAVGGTKNLLDGNFLMENGDGNASLGISGSGNIYTIAESSDEVFLRNVLKIDENRLLFLGGSSGINPPNATMYAFYYKEPGTSDIQVNENQIFGIYPNPAQDQFQINNPAGEKITSLEILNINGQLIYQTQNPNTTVTLPESISNGFYQVRLRTANGQEIHKLYIIK